MRCSIYDAMLMRSRSEIFERLEKAKLLFEDMAVGT